ncbi:MAG: hypothetical protein Q9221_007288 [Calogaya cf. arnoldii]
MATSNNTRTVDTLELSQFKRQLHHWFFNERQTMSQIKGNFDILFRRLTNATCVKYSINERQWDYRAKKWMQSCGLTKSQQGQQVPMPEHLKALPLWYDHGQELIGFHACTPENCNSCVSSRRQAGVGHLNPAIMPRPRQCPNCGTTCTFCANPMSVAPPEMMRSYSGPPMTTPYAAVPNVVDIRPSVLGTSGYQYSPHLGVNPSHLNLQPDPRASSQYNFATGNPGAHLAYRTAAPILGSTETSAEPRRATPVSRKRSRRNSVEPDRVVEVPVETEDAFNDWLA